MQNKEHCLYCGSSGILPVDKEHFLTQSLHIMQCPNCKIMFTETEQKLDADKTALDYKPDFDISDEEATLNAAWKMIHDNNWNNAFELLFQHSCPLKHTADFIIYRDLWQLKDALNSFSLLDNTKDFDYIYTCDKLFDLLINNLIHIEYYLSSISEEQRFKTLKRLHEALLDFSGNGYFISRLNANQQDTFCASVAPKRFTAVAAMADILENLQQTENGLEYLKMAEKLWSINQKPAVAQYKEFKNTRRFDTPFTQIYPTDAQYKTAVQKAEDIMAVIRRNDPDYQPAKLPFWKRAVNQPSVFPIVLLLAVSLFTSLPFIMPGIDHFFSPKLTDNLLVLAFVVIIGFSIIFFLGVGVWAVFKIPGSVKESIKNKQKIKKEQAKRRQLHDRVFE